MLSQKLGVFALNNYTHIQSWINEVNESRELFYAWCKSRQIKFYRSEANFVLFEVKRPNELCSNLKSLGIQI